jgi:hypothetical protein
MTGPTARFAALANDTVELRAPHDTPPSVDGPQSVKGPPGARPGVDHSQKAGSVADR